MESGGVRLGERLRQLLKARKMTQAEFFRRMGLPKATGNHYVVGARFPPPELLLAFAEFFDVTVDYLLGHTEDPQGRVPLDLPHGWEETIRRLAGRGYTPEQVERIVELVEQAAANRQPKREGS